MAYGKTNSAIRKKGVFTFTVGDTVYTYNTKDDLDNEHIKTVTNTTNKTVKCWIKTSGTLYFKTLPKSKKAKAFACGAGGNGGVNYGAFASHYCGRGGQGGRTSSSNSIDLIARSQLAIVVGSSDTSGFGLLAAKGLDGGENDMSGVGAGGVGGHFYSDPYFGGGTTYHGGASGTDGVYAFDDSSFDGIKYGGGGGGGEAGVSGGNAGGLTGGGHGYGQGVTSMDGTANTGGGGGGGPLNDNVSGTGGTGIFIFETLEAES